MFFQSWGSMLATAVTGVSAYAALIAMLRLSGKRTLAKVNAFDLVVTWRLGPRSRRFPFRGRCHWPTGSSHLRYW